MIETIFEHLLFKRGLHKDSICQLSTLHLDCKDHRCVFLAVNMLQVLVHLGLLSLDKALDLLEGLNDLLFAQYVALTSIVAVLGSVH